MLHKSKALMDGTSHSRTYHRARRRYIANKMGGCDLCPPNRGDNGDHGVDRCWKVYRHRQWRGSRRVTNRGRAR